MERALGSACWLGLPTNADFLRRVVEHEAFRAGELRTDFLDVHRELFDPGPDADDEAWIAAALASQLASTASEARTTSARRHGAWDELDGFRLGGAS